LYYTLFSQIQSYGDVALTYGLYKFVHIHTCTHRELTSSAGMMMKITAYYMFAPARNGTTHHR